MKVGTVKTLGKDIFNTIQQHDCFMITSHVRTDGDGIGSEIAIYHTLKAFGKSVGIVNDSQVPQAFKFIVPDTGMYIYPEIPPAHATVVFTLDCPTLDRLGKIKEILPHDSIIINIDHHISNEYFGTINWVDENMCSTGEMILLLLREMNIEINPDIATALYVAIVTDTGRFTHSNTTPGALRAAAFLIEKGARHSEISNYVYNAHPFTMIQLHAQVLNTIRLHMENKVATILLTREMLDKTQINAIDAQEFADIPVSIDGVSVGVLFREMKEPDWVKVSLRSRNGFNVNNIAKTFGGGGHKYASGFEIKGSIAKVQELVLHELEKALSVKMQTL